MMEFHRIDPNASSRFKFTVQFNHDKSFQRVKMSPLIEA